MNWVRSIVLLAFLAPAATQEPADNNAMLREEIVKSMLSSMGKLTKILSSMRDEDSAKASTAELKKAVEAWRFLVKKADDVPPPSRAEADQLAKAYKGKMEAAQKLLFAQIVRVQMVPGGKEAPGK